MYIKNIQKVQDWLLGAVPGQVPFPKPSAKGRGQPSPCTGPQGTGAAVQSSLPCAVLQEKRTETPPHQDKKLFEIKLYLWTEQNNFYKTKQQNISTYWVGGTACVCRGVWFLDRFPKLTDSSYQLFPIQYNRCVSDLSVSVYSEITRPQWRQLTSSPPSSDPASNVKPSGVREKEPGRFLLSSKTGWANSTGCLGAVAPSSVGLGTSASLRSRRKVWEDTPNKLYQRNKTSTPNTVFY